MFAKPVTTQVSDLLYLNSRLYRVKFCTQIPLNPNKLNSASSSKSSKFLVFCNSQITRNGRNGYVEEAELIFNRMPHKNTISWTAMLTAYAENGRILDARKMFDKMPQRSTASYNAMITAYYRQNMIDEAFGLFSSMPNRNSISYAAMITGLVQGRMFDMAEKLYRESLVLWKDHVSSNVLINGYLKAGRVEEAVQMFEFMEEKDVISWSSMIDGYCKIGRTVDARNLFDKMPLKNVVTWTSMIDGYMKFGNFEDGFILFLNSRRQRVEVNDKTLTVLFDACGSFGRYEEGIQIHGLVSRLGFDLDVFLGNSMITMYSRCSCIDEAAQVFHLMTKKDVVTWNSMIAGYIKSKKINEAFSLFEKMSQKDVVSWTTMITGFSDVRMTKNAVQLFQTMPNKDDDVVWTAVISGFVNNAEYKKAFHWFIKMIQKEIKPNTLTLSCVLSAAAGLATLKQGLMIHALVIKMDKEFDISIQNSLVSMYCKCGNVADGYKIYCDIEIPNVVSFNSMITGLAQNGLGEEAITVFTKMQDGGQEPNEITFLGVLSACVHVGLVEEGWKYFRIMKSTYNIEPGVDHYACMVDLLGRAGLLDEAMNLIDSVPFEPHIGIWGSILGASRTHLRLDIAEIAARRLIELEPDNATPYVVLSKLRSILGENEYGELIMLAKVSKRIKKSPGCSWITGS